MTCTEIRGRVSARSREPWDRRANETSREAERLTALIAILLLLASSLACGGEPRTDSGHADESLVDPKELVAELESDSAWRRHEGARALASLGAPAVRALEPALAHPDWVVRAQATWILGEIGAAGLPLLARAARDRRSEVRGEAAHALGRVPSAAAVGPLVAALEDRAPWVRLRAARSLGRIGTRAEGAVPALVDALDERVPEVRRAMSAALISIGALAVPGVIEGLVDPRSRVRYRSAWILGHIGAPAREAVPLLEEVRRTDDNQRIREEAGEALRRIEQAR